MVYDSEHIKGNRSKLTIFLTVLLVLILLTAAGAAFYLFSGLFDTSGILDYFPNVRTESKITQALKPPKPIQK
ncbi:hypothetical protein BmR1_04g07536 [Babesia microti strain RI]|uniref:Uncharacterized protein n=1 Tax=Babesia microti (strain RI) TaxID=1133968 RepID=A0A1N6LXY9_BABMR|nr:hypothetical protein BmR1_04g07536 [Babesia microti strain RI]SIO73749.1 hypothetical protein BmR1_04g07536 [Babesia microti strain RI]|eukprot:XP_021337812.1 hypothetical protein BmR1_04g07536 [Babesia microti strain RI]